MMMKKCNEKGSRPSHEREHELWIILVEQQKKSHTEKISEARELESWRNSYENSVQIRL